MYTLHTVQLPPLAVGLRVITTDIERRMRYFSALLIGEAYIGATSLLASSHIFNMIWLYRSPIAVGRDRVLSFAQKVDFYLPSRLP